MTIEKKVSRIMAILKENGYKYTERRKAIIELLVKEDRYLNAKYISEILVKTYPGLSFDTIYRNLNTYVELKILGYIEIKGERFFKIECFDTAHHHHHHICINCGKAKDINVDLCNKFIIPELEGYTIEYHKFEIYGLCPKCKEEKK